MKGIGIKTPRGPGWEYSLDNMNWQASRIFSAMPDGSSFVPGVTYPIYCRNIAQNVVALASVVFGRPNNLDTLHDVAERGGTTTATVKLLGQLFVGGLRTTTRNDLPQLVVDETGEVLLKGGSISLEPVTVARIKQLYEELPDRIQISAPIDDYDGPLPSGIFRVTNAVHSDPLTVGEALTLQLQLEQQYTNGNWYAATEARSWATFNPTPGATISPAGLLTIPANSISADGTMAVRLTLTVGGSVVEATIQVINNHAPVVAVATTFLTATVNVPFSHTFPSTMFTDADADPIAWDLEYSADGGTTYGALPSWCSFAPSTRTWTGTRTTGGTTYFRKKASDGRGGVAYDPFTLITSAP